MKNYKNIRRPLYVLKLSPNYFFIFVFMSFSYVIIFLSNFTFMKFVITIILMSITHIVLFQFEKKKRNFFGFSNLPKLLNNSPNGKRKR